MHSPLRAASAGGPLASPPPKKKNPKRLPSRRDRAAAAELAERYRHLIRYETLRARRSGIPRCVDRQEMVSACLAALYRAAEIWDESRNVSFKNYAKQRMRKSILDRIREIDWISRADRAKAPQLKFHTNTSCWGDLAKSQNATGFSGEFTDPLLVFALPQRDHIDHAEPSVAAEAKDVYEFLQANLSQPHADLIRWRFIEHQTLKQIGAKIWNGRHKRWGVHESLVCQMLTDAFALARDLLEHGSIALRRPPEPQTEACDEQTPLAIE